MWFETEEEFFAAASRCASLYFLPERRIVFGEASLQPPDMATCRDGQCATYTVIQRGSEKEILDDNTGGALYDAAIVLSRYLAASEAEAMQGKTVLVTEHALAFARAGLHACAGKERRHACGRHVNVPAPRGICQCRS